MATEVVKRLINVEEYYKMAEVGILKPEDRVELINGEIYQMSPIGSRHAAIVNNLTRMLNRLLDQNVIVSIQNPIRIDNTNEPEPDISILKHRSDYYSSAHPNPSDVQIIIEVASSSIKFDQDVKSLLYASCGIPEYWIIDIDQNQIEIFLDPKDGKYLASQIYKPDDTISLLGKKLSVKEIII